MTRAKLRARLELFASALVFGLMAVLVRVGSRQGGGGFSPAQVTVVRFAVGAALTLALFRLKPGTWRPVNHRLLATRGLLGGLAVLFYFLALARIPAGEATLINNTFPVIAVVLSFFTLGERPTAHLWVALLVTSLGVLLVVSGGSGHVLRLGLGGGELAGVASALLGAGAVTSIRRLRATDNAPTIFFAFCVGGLLVALPFSTGAWPGDPRLWAVAAAVGVLSFVAQLLMTDAYGALTVAEAAVWQQLTPIASFLWALPLLGEPVTTATGVGVLVGAAGVVYGTVLGHKPAGAAAAPPPDRTTPTTEPVEPV